MGAKDVEVVPASLSNNQGKTLSWVDALVLRKDLEKQTQEDALKFIEFFNSEEFFEDALVPEWGAAPRYLLPARKSVYEMEKLKLAAPLYPRFLEIMEEATTVGDDDLNVRLRAVGKYLEKRGFRPIGK